MKQPHFGWKCCFVTVCVWLFVVQTISGAALHGVWKYHESGAGTAAEEMEMEMPGDNAEWWVFDYPERPELSQTSRCVWVTTVLPSSQYYQNPVLFFTTTEEAVRVYLDQELLYQSGVFGLYHHTYGMSWHMVSLPPDFAGRQLTFELYSDHPERLGVIDDLSLDEGIYQMQRIFRHDITSILALPLTLLLLIIMLLYYWMMHQRRRLYIYLAIFLALLSVWLVASLWFSMLVWNCPAFWWYLLLGCVYLMPVLGNLIVYEALDGYGRHGVLFVGSVYGILGISGLVGELLGYNILEINLSFYYVWMGVGQFFVVFLLLRAAWQGNRVCRALLLPVLGLPLLGIFDGLSTHFRLFESGCFVTPLGSVFMAVFAIWFMRENMQEEQRLRKLAWTLEQNVEAANERAQIDALTKCYNRGKLKEAMEHGIRIAEADGMSFSVIMLDIDFFKQVNDSQGHDAGDCVLIGFAQTIRHRLDARHVFIRYGGEEFLVLCYEFDVAAACQLADSIVQSVRMAELLPEWRITCSAGVAAWQGTEDTSEKLLKRVDRALYRAKAGGRDQVSVESAMPSAGDNPMG